MTIEFRCSACDQMLRVPDSAAGKQARCPQCKAQMAVPLASSGGASPFPQTPTFTPRSAPPPAAAPPAPRVPGISSDLAKQLDFLRQGMTPRETSAPPPPSNPFGDFSPQAPRRELPPAAPETNPYASPSAAGQIYAPSFREMGESRGFPWERTQNVGTWIETTKGIITEPVSAFHSMWPEGGLFPAVVFWLVGILIMAVVGVAWQFIGALLPGANNPAVDLVEVAIVSAISLVFILLLCVAMLITQSVLLHVLLLMLGGANKSIATTFRVVAYVNGATGWVHIVPCLGGCVQLVLMIETTRSGLATAHATTAGKATAAVIIHAIILFGIGLALFASLVALGVTLERVQ